MKNHRSRLLLTTLLGSVLLTGALSARGADVTGAVDPLGIERFPHSWIVGYDLDGSYVPREYALDRVEKARREVRVEHEVRAPATREWATYEMPDGTTPEEVVNHYRRQVGGQPLFACQGRDCGRSNLWANEIFKRAMLYGPDRNQHYFAGEHRDHLIAVYVIERGNRRVYAHLEVLKPETQVALSRNEEVLERLAGRGMATVEGITPDRIGGLREPEIELLRRLGPGLEVFRGQTVYVVCHLYGPEDAEVLIERAGGCARSAVEALGSESGPGLVPFAAGPLLPRAGSGSRVELVLPHRLSHQP